MRETRLYFISNNKNHTEGKLKELIQYVVRDITMIDSHLRGNEEKIRTLVWMNEKEDNKAENEKVFDLLDECFNYELKKHNVKLISGTNFPVEWLVSEYCECIIVIGDNGVFFELLEKLYGSAKKKVSVQGNDEYVYEFRCMAEVKKVLELYGTFLEHKTYQPKPVIFDAYGTLATIYTNEASSDLWEILYYYIETEIDHMEISPEELKELYFTRLEQMKYEKKQENEYAEYDEKEVFRKLLKKDLFCSYHIDEDLLNRIMKTFRTLSLKYFKIHDNVPETLYWMKQNGYYPLVLLSNSQELYLREEFKEILPAFDLILSSSEIGLTKPSPEVFKIAMGILGLKPEQCIMVGDTVRDDIMPAKELNMKTVYIVASQNEEPIPFELADKVLDCSEFHRLPELIRELEESMLH